MKRKWLVLILVLWVSFLFPVCVMAASDVEEDIFAQFDFGELESFLEDQFPDRKMSFFEMMQSCISGEIPFSLESMTELFFDQLLYELKGAKLSVVNILAIVLIAAVFHNFSAVFSESRISEIGFFVLYMLLITICMNTFMGLTESVTVGLSSLVEFLKLLGPVYFMAVAMATGSATSIAFYQILLLIICIVELVIQEILIPLLQIYMMVRILNDLSPEATLSRLGELIHTLIVWALRTLLGGVIGINVISAMLSPALDSVKRSILTKSGEAIPILGDIIGGAFEVVLGTAVLIRNGIGAAGAIICVAICISPVLQMGAVTLLYQLTAALIEPVSDKRIVGCILSMAEGARVLLRILLTSGVLFLITIAVVANADR